MQESEFKAAIDHLALNCAVMPTDEQMGARVPEIWREVRSMPIETFTRGCRSLTRRPDFKFFPTVGELLGAIEEASAAECRWEGNIDAEQRRRVDDPAYRKKLREESEVAARAYFESSEHKALLATMAKREPSPAEKVIARLNRAAPKPRRKNTRKTEDG